MEQLGSYWTDFYEIWYWSILWKSVEKIQVVLKSDKNTGHFTWILAYVYDHIVLISSNNEKCFRHVVENINLNILHSITFFSPKNGAVYEVMWKNVVLPDRLQMTIRRMRIACWTTKPPSPHTHRICIFVAFPRQQWLHEAPQCDVIEHCFVSFSQLFSLLLLS